jgi:membrane-bound metal-dependent hydrolase YbcI (DUF457 family)
MTGPSHLVVGLGAVVFIGQVGGATPNILNFFLVFVGALAPDIDGGGLVTSPSKILKFFIPRFIGKILDAIVGTLGRVVGGTFGHRGFFHWPILAQLMIVGGILGNVDPLIWFGIGYLSHILADFCTVGGVPLFAPLTTKKLSLKLMVTGSPTEAATVVAILVGVLCYGPALLPEYVRTGFSSVRDLLLVATIQAK